MLRKTERARGESAQYLSAYIRKMIVHSSSRAACTVAEAEHALVTIAVVSQQAACVARKLHVIIASQPHPRLFFLDTATSDGHMSIMHRSTIDRVHPPIHPACCISASPLLLCASHSTCKCSSIPTASRSFTSRISWQFVRTFAVRCFIKLFITQTACKLLRQSLRCASCQAPQPCSVPLTTRPSLEPHFHSWQAALHS